MNAEARRALKAALDRAARRRLARQMDDERLELDRRSCSGCGMELDEWTPGCQACRDRHRNRASAWAGTAGGKARRAGWRSPQAERGYQLRARLADDQWAGMIDFGRGEDS